jgi:hypothetical protein
MPDTALTPIDIPVPRHGLGELRGPVGASLRPSIAASRAAPFAVRRFAVGGLMRLAWSGRDRKTALPMSGYCPTRREVKLIADRHMAELDAKIRKCRSWPTRFVISRAAAWLTTGRIVRTWRTSPALRPDAW